MQVGPEPDPTRDYTQHHHISLGGTREGPWAAQEASPWPRRWSDSSWVPNREEYFLRLEIILRPTSGVYKFEEGVTFRRGGARVGALPE